MNKKLILILLTSALAFSCIDDAYVPDNNFIGEEGDVNAIIAENPESYVLSNTALMFDYGGSHDEFGEKSNDLATDLMTEDMVQEVFHFFAFYYYIENNLQNYRSVNHVWNEWLTPVTTNCTTVLRALDLNTTDQDTRHIIGQLFAYRAHAYIKFARMFQQAYAVNPSALGVPVYNENQSEDAFGRNTLDFVYTQIEEDLTRAYTYLDGFNRPTKDRIDQNVAAGMLARMYMDKEDWANMATWAATARQGYSLMSTAEYYSGFADINIDEVMWGADITPETTTFFASYFSHISSIDAGYAGDLGIYKSIDARLEGMIPATDIRKVVFDGAALGLGQYNNVKYFSGQADFSGDYIYMRASEMYLMEAEAKAQMGDVAGAGTALNALLVTSGRDTAFVPSTSQATLLDQIYLQRRIELWGEGFALNDIKRRQIGIDRNYAGTNHIADARFVLPSNSWLQIFQIPISEIDSNPFISQADQNPGFD